MICLMVADPDASNCDSECGVVTVASIAQHVACRLQCVRPDFAGDVNFNHKYHVHRILHS